MVAVGFLQGIILASDFDFHSCELTFNLTEHNPAMSHN